VKCQAGSSKFEFAVVLVVIGALAHILLGRLITLEHETERLEVELTVRHINTGLKLAVAGAVMRGEEARIATLLTQNPLDFLGQHEDNGTGNTARLHWHYEPDRRTLRYQPRQPEAFYGERLEWRFTGQQDDIGRTAGLRLEPLPIEPLK
jgi:hypothetical protein